MTSDALAIPPPCPKGGTTRFVVDDAGEWWLCGTGYRSQRSIRPADDLEWLIAKAVLYLANERSVVPRAEIEGYAVLHRIAPTKIAKLQNDLYFEAFYLYYGMRTGRMITSGLRA